MFLRWRKATWALAIFNALMLWWVVAAARDTTNKCAHETADMLAACRAATAIGAGIGFAFIIAIWFIGFIVLSLVWIMSRPTKRLCPQCGNDVKKGRMTCTKCGHSFAQNPQMPIAG